jgi:LPXTG-motif cell wall-anchored protein
MKLRRLKIQLSMGLLCLFLSYVMIAQVKTETTTAQGPATTVQTRVERGEVVYVSGDDLVVKTEDGRIRNFPNIPESAKVTVDGQQLSIHDLKPGMKLERTITTTSTPQTITTVKTVTGKVWHVSPPNSIILTLEDGSNQEFNIPKGEKFTVDGKEVDAFALRKGMNVSATQIATVSDTVIAQQHKTTGEMPPPPPVQAIQGPLLIIVQAPPPAQVAEAKPPAEAQPKVKELPQTGSNLPGIALLGTLILLSGVAGLVVWSCRTRPGF